MEIDPALDKLPPNAEGELLKQNSKAVLGHKPWRNCYFAVRSDKLLYFKNKEECELGKEPIAVFRMSQIEEIVEAVFSGVPKKHHVNCGFSVVIYQSSTGKRETFNLLAETPESMQMWVYNLRYIKAYWSRKHTRETVINEEQERKLLEKLLREEEDNKEAVVGEYSLSGETSEVDTSAKPHSITLYFDSGTKLALKVTLTDTVTSVLEKVSDRLSSSGDLMWAVDTQGQESVLSSTDIPALLALKGHRFFVLNPAKRVLVVFFNKKDTAFECIAVPTSITSNDVLEHHDVATKIGLLGIVNPGLFLKSKEDSLFDSNECPCDALFAVLDGKIERLGTDYLLVKNKSIGGSQFTRPKRPTQNSRATRYMHSKVEDEVMEEDAQAKAMSKLFQNKLGTGVPQDNTSTDRPKPRMQRAARLETRVSEDATTSAFVGIPLSRQPQRDVSSPTPPSQIPRGGSTGSSPSRTPAVAPSLSGSQTMPADGGTGEEGPAKLQRRGALRPGGSTKNRTVVKNDSIAEAISEDDHEKTMATQPEKTMASQPEKTMATQPEKTMTTQPEKTMTSQLEKTMATEPVKTMATQPEKTMATQPEKTMTTQPQKTMATQPEKTMATQPEKIMATQPQKSTQSDRRRKLVTSYEENKPTTTMSATPTTISATPTVTPTTTATPTPTPPPEEPFRPGPMVINLDKLAALSKAPPTPSGSGDSASTSLPGKPVVPIDVRTPNMLKIVLLQASGPSSAAEEVGAMDLISLSGVCLRNERGTWRLLPGSNFHAPPPSTSTEHTETFPLVGGIRAVFNHTQKCWCVLPPLTATTGEPPPQETRELTDSQKTGSMEGPDPKPADLFVSKKAIVTGVGGAIHSLLAQFEQTRSVEDKRRIGSDMTNPNMGHLVRGALCTAVARVLLDGLKPYRFQGLVTDDIWKVTSSFWQEAVVRGQLLPAVDKQVFQPIRYLEGSYDNNMKFRTLICSALNKSALSTWIETLPNQKDTLNRHYQPTSFLVLVSENEEYARLFNELLVILEPLIHLPFSFSIDFELRQVQPVIDVPAKTNASTGQVVSPPAEGGVVKTTPTQEALPTTSTVSEDQVPSQNTTGADRPQTAAPKSRQTSLDGLLGSWTSATAGWFKKVSADLQQFDFNAGGALSPKPVTSSKPPPPPPPPPVEVPPLRKVEAMFNHVAEEADELPFQKGDILILKGQINQEWYICMKGDQTGIVPANFVRLIDQT